jgi:hypothetical protein
MQRPKLEPIWCRSVPCFPRRCLNRRRTRKDCTRGSCTEGSVSQRPQYKHTYCSMQGRYRRLSTNGGQPVLSVVALRDDKTSRKRPYTHTAPNMHRFPIVCGPSNRPLRRQRWHEYFVAPTSKSTANRRHVACLRRWCPDSWQATLHERLPEYPPSYWGASLNFHQRITRCSAAWRSVPARHAKSSPAKSLAGFGDRFEISPVGPYLRLCGRRNPRPRPRGPMTARTHVPGSGTATPSFGPWPKLLAKVR